MPVVCEKTWLLAQRLAIVSALSFGGAVIVVASINDHVRYEGLILTYRGLGVAFRTTIVLLDDPHSALGRALPIFIDPLARAVEVPTPAASDPAQTPGVSIVVEPTARFEAEARRAAARARMAAHAIERRVAKAALLAALDAIPLTGAIIVASSMPMKDYLMALLKTRRSPFAMASVWFLVAPTEELERHHLGDVKLPVIRPPGLATNRMRAARRAAVLALSNTSGA